MDQKEKTMTDVPPEPDASPNIDPEPDVQPSSEPDGTGDDPQTVIDPGTDAVGTDPSE
jgi:hypothetical protein